VASADELLKHALVRPLTPIEWREESEAPAVLPKETTTDRPGIITH